MNNNQAIEAVVEAAMQACGDNQRLAEAALRVRDTVPSARLEDPSEATLAAWRARHVPAHDAAEVLICDKC